MATKSQINLVKFALKYPDKWHSYAPDRETVSAICGTTNLRIIKVNKCQQFKLRSREHAEQFLSQYAE